MNRQFLFIKSATESIALPVDSFSHAEYTSDTTVSVYFDAKKSGKDATVVVVLTVSSGKANNVVSAITNQVSGERSAIIKYDDVNDNFSTANVVGITSITTTEGPAMLVPSGGEEGEVLTKLSATDYDVTWEDVHTVYVDVRNQSGGELQKGTPVHATDATGNVSDVIAADASDANAMPATYVLNETLADGATGQAIVTGRITGVDTSSFDPGDVIYVASGGGFTNVKPTGTNLIQNLGVVTKSNANNGGGVVMGAGRSNDVPNIADGYAWIGNASGVATPTLLADVATSGSYNDLSDKPTIPSGTVDTSGTPAVQQLAVFTDADTIEGDANLTWNGSKLVLSGTLDADRISSSAKNALSSAGNYAVGSEILGFVYSSSALTGDAGKVHYLDSATSVTANASTESGGSGMLVVVTDAEDRDELLTRGVVRVSTTLTSSSIGDIVYLDTTAGAVTTTAPTGSGNVVRIVGHVVKPSANMIYFNPSSDWIVVA